MAYYGGIEGGTTGSRMVILHESGKQVGFSEGPHTNYWHIGMDEAARRIVMLTEDALRSAELPLNTQLKSLGMALSGVNTQLNQLQITESVRRISPNIAEKIYASNDAVGALLTATDENAIVLVAGTGSICKLIRKDMTYVRIGGLGYFLGDEGSAFWIANQAIMAFIKSTEGLYHTPFSVQKAAEEIFRHFDIKHYQELLSYFHAGIDKTFIAKLCERLAKEALIGDQFCQKLFYDAGKHLGRHVHAALRHADGEGLMSSEGMDVICCGSVFKSWNLLESGFRDGLKPEKPGDCHHGRLHLRLLQKTAAIGAAIMAAKREHSVCIPRPDIVSVPLCDIDLMEQDPHKGP